MIIWGEGGGRLSKDYIELLGAGERSGGTKINYGIFLTSKMKTISKMKMTSKIKRTSKMKTASKMKITLRNEDDIKNLNILKKEDNTTLPEKIVDDSSA